MQLLLFIILFILVWAIGWSFFSWAFSRLGGWTALAQAYPALPANGGQQWYYQSAAMKPGFYYGASLIVSANKQGISISNLFPFPFSFAQPPFFVPWNDILGKETRKGLYNFIELRFKKTPSIPVTINTRLANKFEQVNGNQWRYVRINESNPQNKRR